MAYIELDRSAFFHNLDIIAQQTGSVDKIALVLKDNAYGHGLMEMSAMASHYGLSRAVVRNDHEAQMVSGYFDYVLVLADIPEMASDTIRYTVNTLEQISRFPEGCRVEIKVDTGMHRNGITVESLETAFKAASDAGLVVEGVFTHHRSADTLSSEWFWQKKQFETVKKKASELARQFGFEPLRFHSCNSAALFRDAAFDEDMARIGIAAYGCLQMDMTLTQPELKPVLSLYAQKIAERTLETDERVGYNGLFAAEKSMTVSTYDVGYADGMLRAASNGYTTPDGSALLGRISMDNTTFVSKDEALLIFNDANSYAEAAGTIGYEVLTGMRSHLTRTVKE
jgi:alanine racemase